LTCPCEVKATKSKLLLKTFFLKATTLCPGGIRCHHPQICMY
jgi:hypothetical protein